MRIALIEEITGIVDNIAEFNTLQEALDMGFNAADMGNIPAGIGDIYANGKFYRNGQEIIIPNVASIILQDQIDLLRECILEISQELYGGA